MNFLGGILKNLKDCIFPVFCIKCEQEGKWWCENCQKQFRVGVFYCPVCHLKNFNGRKCLSCTEKNFLDSVVSFFDYKEDDPPAILIRNLKYNFAFEITGVFEEVARQGLKGILPPLEESLIMMIPVPLHPSRFKERGFNQSEFLAKSFLKTLDVRFVLNTDLKRVKKTEQQAKLNKKDRLKNITGAFTWSGNLPPAKIVFLVDDVYTSGATMSECARVLKENGVKEVYGLTVARD